MILFSKSGVRTFKEKYYLLLERLKDERNLNSRLKQRTEELQDDLLQRSSAYEIEIDNFKIERIEMKRRIRHLQKESSYPDLFEEYERQIKKLTKSLNELDSKCHGLEAVQMKASMKGNMEQRKVEKVASKQVEKDDVYELQQLVKSLQSQIDHYKSRGQKAFEEQEKFEECKRNLRLMSIKVVDLERYLTEAEKDRDNFMKRVASLEGENKALRENEEAFLSERKVNADEMHAMRLYVSDVDKEKRKNDLLARFVRKHTSDMAPPAPPELELIQRSLNNSVSTLKKQLIAKFPRSISNFNRIERELNNLFVEIDRLRIRELDLLDALRNVVEENEANQEAGRYDVGMNGEQSYASRKNLHTANSLLMDSQVFLDQDNESSISQINGDIQDKNTLLEAQRKQLTESIIDGL